MDERTIDDLIHDAMCPRCEARPGDECVTVTGNRTHRPHSARQDPILSAYGLGYTEGEHDGQRVTSGGWWISDGGLPDGRKVAGPFESRDIALQVRTWLEAHPDAGGLTFWVDQEPATT